MADLPIDDAISLDFRLDRPFVNNWRYKPSLILETGSSDYNTHTHTQRIYQRQSVQSESSVCQSFLHSATCHHSCFFVNKDRSRPVPRRRCKWSALLVIPLTTNSQLPIAALHTPTVVHCQLIISLLFLISFFLCAFMLHVVANALNLHLNRYTDGRCNKT